MNYFCSTIIAPKVEMMHKLKIAEHSDIYIGEIAELLPKLLPERRIIVITDANIDRRYHSLLQRYEYIMIGTGETVKTMHTVETIYRKFIESGIDRSCFVLGIGGGIVTDIAGFAASTYMRGIDFGFVSTTLLGQVDAGIGGKNGVNVDRYKNMVGTFTQPRFVICDVEMLHTLPDREFRAGLAEVIKAGIIADNHLFEILERTTFDTLRNNTELLAEIVLAAVKVKAGIVNRDEKESGERRKLNLGHTFAHAIEKCSSALNHGEAVAVGIMIISRIAVKLGVLTEMDAARIATLFEKFGFETISPVTTRRMTNAIAKDKKTSGEFIHIVLPVGIGGCEIRRMRLNEIAAIVE